MIFMHVSKSYQSYAARDQNIKVLIFICLAKTPAVGLCLWLLADVTHAGLRTQIEPWRQVFIADKGVATERIMRIVRICGPLGLG